MPAGVLHPRDVGPADAARVLAFLNGVAGSDALAETIGLSDGLAAGQRVAAALIAARQAAGGAFRGLDQVLAVTGVNLGRFTEIVTALSSALPAPRGGTLRLLPVTLTPWLGQGVAVAAQLLDGNGRGVAAARITCMTVEGVLSAREGLEAQSGGAVSLTTEPGGLVRFTLGPPLWPPLTPPQSAALAAALARLDASADTPAAAAKGLAGLTAAYRAEGSAALRTAVDRLSDSFPAEAAHPRAPWPVRPVSLIALAEGPGGATEIVATATLRQRNWLGGFLAAMRAAVEGDERLGTALKNLDGAAARGADLSRTLTRATQGFAALEQGALASRLRDAAAGRAVNAFLDTHAATLKGEAVVNSVRAAGASTAAIAAGGFAVFEAIRTVQDAGPAISAPTKGLDLLGTRVTDLEAKAERQPDFGTFRDELLGEVDSRVARGASAADLAALRGEIFRDLDTRLSRIVPGVTAADLDAFRATLTRDVDARLAAATSGTLTRAAFDAAMATLRRDLSSQIDTTATTLGARIDAKADAGAVAGLQTALTQTNLTLASRIDGLDGRLVRLDPGGPIRPIR